MPKLAVLVSGGGTNLQAIIDAIAANRLPCNLSAVVADRECLALERAQAADVPAYLLDRKVYGKNLSAHIHERLDADCDLLILAGFLSILDSDFIAKWPDRIINLHPSLLPRHGGAGMWGLKVHQAVIDAGDTESGCTIHYVNNTIDGGEIILQKKIQVAAEDNALELQKKVQRLEQEALIKAVSLLLDLPH